ncbi:DUF421 domain-containing protein [Paenibacillus radicis (ex Xue et al. 2023)]|uniref:DUF421 domain-containing protein n=1 Tax=Paenibacillus radicis (ex Xue et al. 2023) TaxID=2972489 RepID=A0ABT1YEJ5_9BACL|nr:DUF421 domain-containing protein [Paenibacillus radicis (ex Xue et al. 2023)]MCR8631581.1 DUF421 domain-containing protein [Paenibacillus radicis (ex Xue et al. 2023)]
MDFYYITVKLATAMVGLWLITKLLGKKEISQLTAFDFVSSLMLSEIVGNTLYDKDVHLTQLLYALALWTALSLGLEKLVQFIPGLSRHLNGTADLIIVNGQIDFAAMKRNNLDFDQLHTLLREQNIFSVREVGFAVFETNGNLSVKKKTSLESVTRQDLQLPEEPLSLSLVLVENGRVQKKRLEHTGHSMKWLLKALKEQGAARIEDVLYAEWDESKGMFCQMKK